MSKIIVFSLDFDGCLFHNRGGLARRAENPLISNNKIIIDKIIKKISRKAFDQTIFMVGSNRQSHAVDLTNAMRGKSGSCFKAMQEFSKEINRSFPEMSMHLDPYLLADSYGKTPIGENLNNAVDLKQNYKFSDWFFDQSKLTILYAQMHKLASENREKKIEYNFFEDLYYPDDPDDILDNLRIFFSSNPDLIPKNVTLKLNFYNGAEHKELHKIKGTGNIDQNYAENIRLMIERAGLDYKKDYYVKNNVMAKLVENDGLNKFKKDRKISRPLNRLRRH